MVCIAAFIILAICVLSIPVIRIFNKNLANKIWKLFRESMGCVGKRVTFRKCDSTFKDQVKNGLLKKVVLKHPGWVKPLSVIIEILSVLIIAITIWSLLVGIKSGVGLYVYGTCDVTTPEACVLDSTEACTIDGRSIDFWNHPIDWTANWFVEFGEAIMAIPARSQHWNAQDFMPSGAQFFNAEDPEKPYALDIFDPGCVICKQSFRNQLNSDFFNENNVAMLVYPIRGVDGPKYANSVIITSYIESTRIDPLTGSDRPAEWLIVKRLFTENSELMIDYQTTFNDHYSNDRAREVLQKWLADFGYSKSQVKKIADLAESDQIKQIIADNQDIVDNQIRTRKIPTLIFDGRRHEGAFKP